MGGLLIGVASLLLLITTGRIAGISGIVGGALRGPDRGWRLAFVAGLLAAGAVGFQAMQGVDLNMQAGGGWLVVAGLLVGLGTRMGSGCTSGHGVCGLGRRSPRSVAATVVFIAVGMVTVFVTRHLLEWL
ncbi:YeeE/YedE family protein [Abyssibacter profundi]|nr:hypothetical protein [Abyssibacter profundi]